MRKILLALSCAVCMSAAAKDDCKSKLSVTDEGLGSSFTTQVEDVELDPQARRMRVGHRETHLSPLECLVMESLLLDGLLTGDEFSHIQATNELRMRESEDPTYKNAVIHRLREKLRRDLGDDVAARLITLHRDGFAWLSSGESEIPEGFDLPADRSFLRHRGRYFPVRHLALHLLQLLADCQPVSLIRIGSDLEDAGHSEASIRRTRVYISRVNREISATARIDGRPILIHGRMDEAVAQLNPKLFPDCAKRAKTAGR